jgi:hypothetical protein
MNYQERLDTIIGKLNSYKIINDRLISFNKKQQCHSFNDKPAIIEKDGIKTVRLIETMIYLL